MDPILGRQGLEYRGCCWPNAEEPRWNPPLELGNNKDSHLTPKDH